MRRYHVQQTGVLLLGIHLLWVLPAQAQQPATLPALEERFEQGVSLIFQEKVFVDTDKTTYVPGETLWFSAYCVDATFHTLSDLSQVLYVELLDGQGHAWFQEKIRLRKGRGQGQLYLHGELPTGNYSLKAYTSWMRNAGPAFFYRQNLLIVNPFLPSPPAERTALRDTIPEISFFPEGGALVAGLPARLAVWAQQHGSGLAVDGTIQDPDGQIVARFQTSERGLGDCSFTPAAGVEYVTQITDSQGTTQRVPLPASLPAGATLTLQHRPEKKTWELTARTQGISGRRVYAAVHSRGIMRMARSRELQNGAAVFLIPHDSLLTGISHFTLFDETFAPIAERLLFRPPGKETQLRVSTSQPAYGNRQEVNIDVSGDFAQAAHASVSVYRTAPGTGPDPAHIVSWMLLDADLSGPVRPTTADWADSSALAQLDLLLLTSRWTRFQWEEVLAGQSTRVQYPLELNAPMLSGSLAFPENQPRPEKIQVTFPGEYAETYSAAVNETGRFFLELSPEIRHTRAIFWNQEMPLSEQAVRLQPHFFPRQVANPAPGPDTLPLAYIRQSSIHAQIANGYLPASHIRGWENTVKKTETPFYGKPDVEYRLDEYTRFPTMDEVFSEFISAAVKRRSGLYIYDLYANLNSISDNITFEKPALIMIDGVPVQDEDFFWQFDPLKVEKIHVVQRAYRSGEVLYPGLVNLITYHRDFGDGSLPAGLVARLYQGLQQDRHFYAPDYATRDPQESRVPDLRNVLHWEPGLSLLPGKTTRIRCFTGDDAGSYRIEVNGMTEDGIPLHGTATFEVKSL